MEVLYQHQFQEGDSERIQNTSSSMVDEVKIGALSKYFPLKERKKGGS